MALKKVYLWDPAAAKTALPDIKYVGDAPALPITVDPRTEEVEMSDKSRRLAFFPSDKREWTLGWGYLTWAELDKFTNKTTGLLAIKTILNYENEFEAIGTIYNVYIVSFSYEFVRPGIRDLKRFRAEMTLREV